ncbi:MAG TPA: hemolysin family protein [Vicinamibacterales bacterium]|nr:hemolysin family protein [Vicinamibacterales bacterium]
MGITEVLLICLALVVVNGVFVAAEFALLAAPRPALERSAATGDRFARTVLNILQSPMRQDRYIATAQLGISLASLGLGMYGEHRLTDLLEPVVGRIPTIGGAALAATISLGVLTLAHIVFGEMVPKGLALQRPVAVARITAWPMRLTLILLYPLVKLSSAGARACLRLVGIERQQNVHEQVYTPEELQLIVEESEEGGALRAESGRLLRELFEFGGLTAGQVMVPRVRIAGIPLGAQPDEIRKIIAKHRHTRYAVYEKDLDHIVGMVHVKDLLRKLLQNAAIGQADIRRLPVVPETALLDDVLTRMQQANAHMTVVIDEHGGTAGILSLEDLFEEVVGEIDEGASAEPPISRMPDGTIRAAGTVRLDELGQFLDLDLEHEDVDSLSGLVLARLGRPPVQGDVVEYGRLRLEVTATSGRGVKDVRVSVMPEE